jgi:hypothetical protein
VNSVTSDATGGSEINGSLSITGRIERPNASTISPLAACPADGGKVNDPQLIVCTSQW